MAPLLSRALRALLSLLSQLLALLRAPFQSHPCRRCEKCAEFSAEPLFVWLRQRVHLPDYAHLVLSKRVLNRPLHCSVCGCARQHHGQLQPQRLTFDMIPNGGVVLVEHHAREQILRRRKRFAGVHGAGQQPQAELPSVHTQQLKDGHGAVVRTGDQIRVHYDAYVRANMRKFESSRDGDGEPLQLTLGDPSVVKGWSIGLDGAKVGCVRRLTVPAHLAFGLREIDGEREVDVVFDVQLLSLLSSS